LAPNGFAQQTTVGRGKLLACFINQIHLSKDDDLPLLGIKNDLAKTWLKHKTLTEMTALSLK
jgi:hypothetical protein